VEVAKVKGLPPGDGRIDSASVAADDLVRRLPFLAAIESGQIEVMPVGDGLSPELGAIAKALPIKELIFDEPMDRLDIALPSVGLGRDVTVIAAQRAHRGG